MLANEFHKAITYIRETQEVALFSTMADTRWYSAFGGSPLFFIMLPFIGILLTLNALMNAYKLIQASNKNLDKWFNLIISATCAFLRVSPFTGRYYQPLWALVLLLGHGSFKQLEPCFYSSNNNDGD